MAASVETLTERERELRRCLRDLLALSTLPAFWRNRDAVEIADSAAAALVSMIDADFVYLMLPGLRDEPGIEVTRTADETVSASSASIRQATLERLPQQLLDGTAEIPDPLRGGTVRIACAPIGLGGDAVVIAGSSRPDFPPEAQHLILRVGANHVAIAVERWRAEADQRRFSALVERSSDFIGFASPSGMRQYLNPAGLKLVGLASAAEACGLHVLDFVAPEERERVRDELWPLVMREGRWVGELNLRHFQTGASIPFLVDWFRVDDPRTGQPTNIATVSRDLTAQKRAEAELRELAETLEHRVAERASELLETNRQLVAERIEHRRADARLQELQTELFHAARLSAAGQMAAALAHELNQPLTAASNFVNAARRGLAAGDLQRIDSVRKDMDEAVGQVLRAGRIISRLREFATRGETEKQIVSIETMVLEAGALALSGAAVLGVEVRFRFEQEASSAFADQIQIQQVLVNLMRNALEAMEGSRRRELTMTTALLDEKTVQIAVADSGPGLAKDMLDRLSEPFASTKRHGMGLGLSICRSIVEAHGGWIGASENPDGGLTFRFTLPAAARDDDGDVG